MYNVCIKVLISSNLYKIWDTYMNRDLRWFDLQLSNHDDVTDYFEEANQWCFYWQRKCNYLSSLTFLHKHCSSILFPLKTYSWKGTGNAMVCSCPISRLWPLHWLEAFFLSSVSPVWKHTPLEVTCKCRQILHDLLWSTPLGLLKVLAICKWPLAFIWYSISLGQS